MNAYLNAKIDDDYDDVFEWVDGERITLREYDARIQKRTSDIAAQYLFKMNHDCNWIFGLSH